MLNKLYLSFAFDMVHDPFSIYCGQRFKKKTWPNVYNIIIRVSVKISTYSFPKKVLDFGDLWCAGFSSV